MYIIYIYIFIYMYLLYIYSCCNGSIPWNLVLIGRDGGLSTVSWLRVCLAGEGAKIVSWPWLCLLRGWGSLIMAVTGKFEIFIMHVCHPNMHIKAQYTLSIF